MIIFGDSLTSGENNNNRSFADYLGIEKYATSGTCLDDYSIYPVKGGCVHQIWGNSDVFLLEYGINDAASLVTGYIGIESVKISIAKVCDLLQGSDVYFLMLSESLKDLMAFSTRYARYLNTEYLKDLYDITAEDYLWCYSRFCELMQRKFKTLYLLPDGFKEYDRDGIHPTDKGHRLIAENIERQLKKAT